MIPDKDQVGSPALPSTAHVASLAAEVGDKAPDHRGGAQYANPGVRSVLADRPHDLRQALPPVRPYPAPVAGPLPPAEYGAPGAPHEREVQHDDGVSGPEPDVEPAVIGAEVAIQNPGLGARQFALTLGPFGWVGRGEPGLPEQRVQLDHRQAGQLANLPGQDRLASTAPAENHHSSHTPMIVAEPAFRSRVGGSQSARGLVGANLGATRA